MLSSPTTGECQCTCYWCIFEAPKHDMCNWGCKILEKKPKAKIKQNTTLTPMPKQQTTEEKLRDWEKEFDNRFGNYGTVSIMELGMLEEEVRFRLSIKSFIRSLLSQTATQTREEIREIVSNQKFVMKIDEYLPKVKAWNKTNYDVPFDDGYAQAIHDILSNLKEKQK